MSCGTAGCGAPPSKDEAPAATPAAAPAEPKAKKITCSSCGKPNAEGYTECACGEPAPGAKKSAPAKTPAKAAPAASSGVGATIKCGECGKPNAQGYKGEKLCRRRKKDVFDLTFFYSR